jgi:hypothetical protein
MIPISTYHCQGWWLHIIGEFAVFCQEFPSMSYFIVVPSFECCNSYFGALFFTSVGQNRSLDLEVMNKPHLSA